MAVNDEAERIANLLKAKRGQGLELADVIASELALLHSMYAQLADQIRELKTYQEFLSSNDLISSLEESFGGELDLPEAMIVDAFQLFDAQDGFYPMEYTAQGSPYRWTGPERHFSFSVNVDRSKPLAIWLEVAEVVDDERQTALVVLADGVPYTMELEPRGEGGYAGRLVLAPRPRFRGFNLTFIVPVTLQREGDMRKLGVAFQRLAIAPFDASAAEADAALAVAPPKRPPLPRATKPLQGEAQGKSVPKPEEYTIHAGQLAQTDSAFHDLEFDGAGRPYRWTAGQPSFDLLINRDLPLRVELTAIAFLDEARQTPVKVTVDDATYEMDFKATPNGQVGTLLIPPRPRAKRTRLTFDIPVLEAGGVDQRRLGLAFRSLQVKQAPLGTETAPAESLGAAAEPQAADAHHQ